MASTDYSRRSNDFFYPKGISARLGGILIIAVLLAQAGIAGGGPLPEILRTDPEKPWEIKADTVEYDAVRKVYVARDGVVISKGIKRLSADHVTFDHKNMTASAEGNVMMTTGEDVLTGDRIDIDLEKETGTIHQGKVFAKEKNFHIRGERVEKVGKNEYQVYKASVTTCDGETPAWRITARNLDITLEGYGKVKNGTFWVKNVPIAFSPYFIFPVKKNRQTGLLFPEFGNSDRKGLSYNQPLFWAIDDSQDATFYNYFMSERGDKVGAEYRYVLDERSKGTVMLDYLDDRKIDDGTGTSSADWGYEGDAYLRPNHDRYWFRAKVNQALPLDFSSRLDLDIVSDQDYLYEFQDGHSGFDATRKYFNQHFGREVDDYTDPIRTNSLNLNKIWSAYSFNAEALWYDNVVKRRWEETDTTLQRLPLVSFNSVNQKIMTSPVYWSMESNYAHFFRQEGDRGHRMDIWPRFSMPYRLKDYLFLEPSVGLRETIWNVNGEDTELGGLFASSDQNLHREMFDARLDLATRLSRIYAFSPDEKGILSRLNMRPEKIKHNLRPEIVYEFVPDRNQDEYPFFDPADRVFRKNRVTFSLVNSWVSKSKRVKPEADPASGGVDIHPVVDYTFRQFCRFEVSQSYDADTYDADDLIYEYDLVDRTTPEPGEHLSPFYARLDVEPADFYTVSADMEWSHLEDAFLSGNIGLTLRDKRGDLLYTEYRSTRDSSESLYAGLQARLTSWLSTYAEYEQNIRDSENIKTGVGFIYTHPCWSMNMRFLQDREDQSFGVMVDLAGLGGAGVN
ncbi:LPS-assembly protein LptD [Desulfococcus sp.]|uniref:LPS-assembly protein LptD n=1 Tax=Desulfococcus sp. TaxID=2025834 RepID=UPI0035935A90